MTDEITVPRLPLPGMDERPFEPLGPLPSGRTTIEASAGTGKTHALATLATRFVAEGGVSAAELLVVTFTRAAANELRAKIRQRIVEVALGLEGVVTDHPADDDGLAAYLGKADRSDRLARLHQAIAEFDAATITTIHGFAFQVRAALGAGSGADPSDRVLPDHRRLVREACTDVLAAAATGPMAESGLPKLDQLVRLVERVDGRPDLSLYPTPDLAAPPGLAALGTLVRQSVDLAVGRRRAAGLLSFDDVLTRFRDVLADPAAGASAARSLGARYRVVLIDEFQDTDPVQWEILSGLFGGEESRSTLVLVGDPKQSIYGFRGADVHTYRRALADPRTSRFVLSTNRRSDEALLDSLSAILDGATFGDGISFLPVDAAPGRAANRLCDAKGDPLPAFSLRLAVGPDIGRRQHQPDWLLVDEARRAVLADLTASVGRLLDQAWLPADESRSPRRLRPGDVAVLAPRNQDTLDVQAALRDQGIPAVVTRAGSVLESEAATHLRWLLYAMERPSDLSRVRLAALSWFGGWSARQVADAGEDDPEGALAALQEQLRAWADALAVQPVAAVFGRIRADTGVLARLLSRSDGDRNVTDLDHLAEYLGTAVTRGRAGPATLLATLDEEPDPSGESEAIIDVDEDVTARRLESDADCVQVMTTWTAKGLQFPVVCLPMLWWESRSKTQPPNEFVDPVHRRRVLDLTIGQKQWSDVPDKESAAERQAAADREVDGEHLRALYVALTRAQHANLAWWARTEQSESSAMARVLFGREHGRIDRGRFSACRVAVPSDHELEAALRPVVRTANRRHVGAMEVLPIGASAEMRRWEDPTGSTPDTDLAVALAPTPDRRYQRWSFSAIVDRAAANGIDVTDLGDSADPADESLGDAGAADEPVEPETQRADQPEELAAGRGPLANPMADLVGGADFGTLVHSVLEMVDWQAPDLEGALGEAVDGQLRRRPLAIVPGHPVEGEDPTAAGRRLLVAGLRTALTTPLGPRFAGRRLTEVTRADRLSELSFDLRLGTDGHPATTGEVAAVVGDLLPDGDPFSEWGRSLVDRHEFVLGGNLTGSIDLVARVPGGECDRYVVADYKTNTLHDPSALPAAPDYGSDRLVAAMAAHDYPLQALLYSVALHRYLRWRLPGYQPARHLGGVAYLFVRGMDGTHGSSGDAHGACGWDVPHVLVTRLSDLLDGVTAGAHR